jgi:hypothetical protein
MRATILGLAILAAAASPAVAAPKKPASAMVAAGNPVTCIDRQRIRQSKVIDDQTIDFVMNNGQVMRNHLPNRCPGLGFERAFSYSTSINQLCNVDIITVVNQGGAVVRGASCGLGQFQPVKPEAVAQK